MTPNFQIMSFYSGFSWGANSYGQLSQGDNEDKLAPQTCILPKVSSILRLVGGGMQSLLLSGDGKLYGSGRTDECSEVAVFSPLKPLELQNVVNVAAGWDFALACTSNGEVFSWGGNAYAQLSVSADVKFCSKPIKVNVPRTKQVAAGLRHALALTVDGKVYSWGSGRKGQLGIQACPVLTCSPTQVEFQADVGSVLCGSFTSAALSVEGRLYVWGANNKGQLGLSTSSCKHSSEPLLVSVPPLRSIACGWTHFIAICRSGDVISWGRNDYGQLGRPSDQPCCWEPGAVIGLPRDVKDVQCGAEFSVALTTSECLYTWGWNEHGMCADGTEDNRFTPHQVDVTGVKQFGTGCGWVFAVTQQPNDATDT